MKSLAKKLLEDYHKLTKIHEGLIDGHEFENLGEEIVVDGIEYSMYYDASPKYNNGYWELSFSPSDEEEENAYKEVILLWKSEQEPEDEEEAMAEFSENCDWDNPDHIKVVK